MKKHIVFNSIKIKFALASIIVFQSIFFSNLNAQGENTGGIYGMITDSETGNPIEYAAVFLANTSLGVLTDKNGAYVIKNIPTGAYNLVCALIGYSKVVKPVKISKGSNNKIDAALTEKTISAKEITIIGESPLEWQRRLRRFTKEFLGESTNADNCEIVNPEIIDFEINKVADELIAKAEDEIVILNRSLGYKIKIYLTDFVWSRSGTDGKYQIYPFFEELNSSDENEKNKWLANRANAYRGSFRHFLKSCVEGRVFEEGFRLCESKVSNKWIYKNQIGSLLVQKKMDLDSFIYPAIQKINTDEYCMVYNTLMQVVYLGEREDPNYKEYKERLARAASFMDRIKQHVETVSYQNSWFILPLGQLFFNSAGICSDYSPYRKNFAGYWAWKRVADLLPYDYKYSLPDKSIK